MRYRVHMPWWRWLLHPMKTRRQKRLLEAYFNGPIGEEVHQKVVAALVEMALYGTTTLETRS